MCAWDLVFGVKLPRMESHTDEKKDNEIETGHVTLYNIEVIVRGVSRMITWYNGPSEHPSRLIIPCSLNTHKYIYIYTYVFPHMEISRN